MDAANRKQLNAFIQVMIWLAVTLGTIGGIVYLIRLI